MKERFRSLFFCGDFLNLGSELQIPNRGRVNLFQLILIGTS
ncbi:hypothetical protein C943_03853 [Mariniradius saccharolyticus AK6]|uniref:Uncharacterized protein n=1 Tax=Mariniradius saccharolyticus AK6 TaxID=1239962 RepID=M7XZV2_9BACT|nr:hypothetical protein C943_03853 [Mariniradius saccharolyticus AK6]